AAVHLCATALASLSLIACGGSNEKPAGDGDRRGGPLYVVSTTVFSPDTATSYVAVVDSLAAGDPLDLSDALEIGGGARAYGPEGSDIVYMTSDENATMTEVMFGADGSPEIGRTVSFAQLGIESTTGGNVHLFVSPT